MTLVAFKLLNDATGEELHVGVAAGEVQVLAAVHDRRAGGAHVHFLRAGLVEEVDRFTKLRAAHD